MSARVYKIVREYEGVFTVRNEEGETVARVGRFMPGPMVSLSGQGNLFNPDLARAVARAMTRLANEIDRDAVKREQANQKTGGARCA